MKTRIRNGKLIIELPMGPPKRSSSGKTLVVASTRGPLRSVVSVGKQTVYVVASAFVYPTSKTGIKKMKLRRKERKRAE
jgi:hypothetical protein